MRYLKTWSLLERIDTDAVKDLCDTSFANLYDQGFKVLPLDVNFRVDRQTMVKLVKGDNQILEPFTWSEIKDYYIPFLQLISNRYDFVSFTRQFYPNPYNKDIDNVRIEYGDTYWYVDWKYYSYEDLINEKDEPKYNSKIFSISIIVTNKK